MDIKKPPLPDDLKDLPRFRVTSSPAFTRKDKERSDIAFGVNSLDDLQDRLKEGFATPLPASKKGP
ncbi:MAG: hypothetical protein U1E23_13530 [Reyranellaceae bacterium]